MNEATRVMRIAALLGVAAASAVPAMAQDAPTEERPAYPYRVEQIPTPPDTGTCPGGVGLCSTR